MDNERSPALRFFELETGPHDVLFSQIPARDLVRLMQTCRCTYTLVKAICFNVPRLLSRFFGDATSVDDFRRMQGYTGAIISGSTALQFFNRLTWPNTDLDIYVTRASAAIAVVFILENGYTFSPRDFQDRNVSLQLCESVKDSPPGYPGKGIANVLNFYKDGTKIQLIIVKTTPIEVILHFHSTCVMNIITHDAAFSLYPWSTVLDPVGAWEDDFTGRELKEDARQKYADRGWTIIRSPSASGKSELGVRMVRSVGDRFTWTIFLPPVYDETTDIGSTKHSWQLDSDAETTWPTLC
ncbi:hypothetical protein B0H14DRAFT_2735536 [Mycena olivaceomarginata]|nr:hypothetical protein B0H14DRAFT_2735536 [Mycena olivaceomarginata]